MDSIIIRRTASELSTQEQSEWVALFQECYRKDESSARTIFRKYKSHDSQAWFCLAKQNDVIVACYAGIELAFGDARVFLATDTMSNGKLRNATVKLAEVLYPALRAAGIDAVCGFPNGNIIRIRERKLGWKMTGELGLYVGLPMLWRIGRRTSTSDYLWNLQRPAEGFFARRRRFVSLLGRQGLYDGEFFSLVLTLSAQRPGRFFVKVPERLSAPKRFGWVLTNPGNHELATRLTAASIDLDINTIDVP